MRNDDAVGESFLLARDFEAHIVRVRPAPFFRHLIPFFAIKSIRSSCADSDRYFGYSDYVHARNETNVQPKPGRMKTEEGTERTVKSVRYIGFKGCLIFKQSTVRVRF